MIIVLGPKKSRTNFFKKKGYLPCDKRFPAIFPRIIECNKPQETIYKASQAILTITMELIGAFFKT